jgi:hypothetical protein
MGILDPKPVTAKSVDAVTATKINDPQSATRQALDTAVSDAAFMTALIFGE